MRKSIIFSILFLVILLLSCSKAHRRGWLVGDVTFRDAVSGMPISGDIYLTYSESSSFSQGKDYEVFLGSLDGDGNINFERNINRHQGNFKLNLYASGQYKEPVYNTIWYPSKKVNIYSGSKNKKTVLVDPWFPFLIYTSNTNCTGISDSLFVTVEGRTDTIVGCADSEVRGKYGGSGTQIGIADAITSSILTIQVRTKKSGVENTYSQNFNLIPAEIATLQLNY